MTGKNAKPGDAAELRRTQVELEALRARYFDLYNLAPVGYYTLSEQGTILEANLTAATLLGVARAALVKQPLSRFIVKEDQCLYYLHRKQLLETGAPQACELRMSHQNGTQFWAHIESTAAQDADGAPVCRMAMSDITERKRGENALQESDQRFRTLFETIPGSVFVHRGDRYLDVNAAFTRTTGYTREELLDMPFWELVHPDFRDVVKDRGQARLQGTAPPSPYEAKTLTKSGKERWVVIAASSVPFAGEPAVLGIVIDITDLKVAQAASERQRQLLLTLIEAMPDLIYVKDAESRFLLNNRAQLLLLGAANQEEAAGKTDADFFPPELAAKYRADEQAVLASGEPLLNREERAQDPRGNDLWVLTTKVPFRDSLGHVIGIVGIGRDITERKRAEEALRQSEDNYRSLFETVDEMIFIGNPAGEIIYANPAAGRKLGYSEGVLERMRLVDLHRAEDRHAAGNFLAEIFRGERDDCPLPLVTRDGCLIPVETRVWLGKWNNREAMYGISKDLSAQRAALEMFEKIFSANPTPMALSSMADQTFTQVNDTFCAMTGYGKDEIAGRSPADLGLFVNPDEQRAVAEQLATQGRIRNVSLMLRVKDGSLRHGLFFGEIIESQGERHFLTAMVDVTERERAEEENRRLAELLDLAPGCITVHDFDGHLLYANQRAIEMHGYSRDEFLALNLHQLDVPESEALIASRVQEIREKGEAAFEVTHFRKDGNTLPLALYVRLTRWQDRHAMFSIGTDVTERKRAEAEKEKLEAQLRQSQKMESVGRLAGGVAHDFNNLLQVILGYADVLQGRLGKDVANKEALDAVRQAAERAADLTRQLLAFSRRQIIQPVNLDLNDLLQGMLKMVRRVIGEHIEMCFMPGARLGTVHADKGQIEQVLMNLCVNARDSMAKGGTLTVETENVVIDDAYCHEHPWATEGRYVLLSVTDTGHGMDDATRAQVFEPFFTTKELGQGTGLGLATVYGIVKHHNGFIHVYSEPGKGTAFKIYLPIVERLAEEVGSKIEGPIVGGSETILVAEDEEVLLNLVSRLLEAAGYTVLTASNGEDALRVFEENAGTIDMAILDVMMPKTGGREVMDRIQAKYPRMRFLFSSGYSENAIHTDFVIKEGLRLITKPYRKEDLLRAVRETLDAPPSC